MPIELATWIARAVEVYLVIGSAFGIWFAARGVRWIDPRARAGTLGFRVLVIPGAALLWPWLAPRCVRSRRTES